MEEACTDHLKAVGGYLPPVFEKIEFDRGDFKNEEVTNSQSARQKLSIKKTKEDVNWSQWKLPTLMFRKNFQVLSFSG